MLRRSRYCYDKSSVRPSVRLSICHSVTLRYCDHIRWNTLKMISRLISLGPSLSADQHLSTPTGTPHNFSRNRNGLWKKWHCLSSYSVNTTTGPWALLLLYSVIPIKNALWGWKNGVKGRRGDRILTANEIDLTFVVPNYGANAKLHQNRVRIATDRQTDTQTRVIL